MCRKYQRQKDSGSVISQGAKVAPHFLSKKLYLGLVLSDGAPYGKINIVALKPRLICMSKDKELLNDLHYWIKDSILLKFVNIYPSSEKKVSSIIPSATWSNRNGIKIL